jgi:hypothetical protein
MSVFMMAVLIGAFTYPMLSVNKPELVMFSPAPNAKVGVPQADDESYSQQLAKDFQQMLDDYADWQKSHELGALAEVAYSLDVQIVFDGGAWWAATHYLLPEEFYKMVTWNGLHNAYTQYWSDMDFFVGPLWDFVTYDTNGCNQPWNDGGELLVKWSAEYGWAAPGSQGYWTTHGPEHPKGIGSGLRYDLLVLYTWIPSIINPAWTYMRHNVIVINVYQIWLFGWAALGLPGIWTVLMHECGHDFNLAHDPDLDVMSGSSSVVYWDPYCRIFSTNHQNIVAPNRGIHCH